MGYYGKYSNSKKAVDIELLKIEPISYQAGTSLIGLDNVATASNGLEGAFN